MRLKDLVGTVIPFIGWREYEASDVEEISEYLEDVEPDRRYSGFQIAWLGLVYGYGLRDLGPRE